MEVTLKFLVAKLNPTCRQAMEAAAAACFSRTNYEVDIEHLLFPLMEAKNADVELIFQHFGIDPSRLSRDLTRSLDKLKTGNYRSPSLSPRVTKLLTDAWTVASLEYSAGEIRSGFLLLALLAADDVSRLVIEAAPDLMKLNAAVLKQHWSDILNRSAEGQARGGVSSAPGARTDSPSLDQYTIDLTENARLGKVDPVLGRDDEIRQVIDILTRRRQNNPILTGEAGVGKTAIVEGFALRIVNGDVPPSLKDVSVRTLDLGLLQAGAGVRGEFENRLKSVISEVKASPVPVILFIDEAHLMIGAGGPAGQGDAANLLKPALARGELRTIAATTQAEYKRYFEKDAALTRRFQVVKVEEPGEQQAIDMMRGLVATLEKHHGVRLLDEAVDAAVRLTHRYVTGRQLPDKAVNVLDTACARVAIGLNSIPPPIEDSQRRITTLSTEILVLERETITGSDHQERLGILREQLATEETRLADLEDRFEEERDLLERVMRLRGEAEALAADVSESAPAALLAKQQELAALNAQLAATQGTHPMVQAVVDRQTVAQVVSTWTGVPVGRMFQDEAHSVLNLQHQLGERVVGQSHALDIIAKRILSSRAGLDDPSRPTGVFLLVGPSGVGKTETALALADILYGGERNAVIINMSEYQEAHTVSGLKGSPPGYVGYGEGGILTEAVRRRPYCVVLLDEMEKAHQDVMELFYQVFDKGRMEDSEGREIDFRNTVILMTCNTGAEIIQGACADPRRLPTPDELAGAIGPELRRTFKPALLGRLITVPYYPIGHATLRHIIDLKLDKVRQRIMDHHRITLTCSDELVEAVAQRCTDADTGARNVDNILTGTLIPEISRRVLSRLGEREPIRHILADIGRDGAFRYEVE
ncbi:MAG: type VI secretion system ATPase TssH [Acidobacteria bacterium]|nr:type VI secretion system ATPase TssH [Acidobacteriota bacterium]